MPGDDTLAKAGSEALDLRLDNIAHIPGGAVGHVTVGPDGVLALRRAGGIEAAGLGDQDKRPLSMLAAPHDLFGSHNFLHCPAEMHGAGLVTLRRGPGDGSIQCQVQFEHAGAVAVAGQLRLIVFRQDGLGGGQHLSG